MPQYVVCLLGLMYSWNEKWTTHGFNSRQKFFNRTNNPEILDSDHWRLFETWVILFTPFQWRSQRRATPPPNFGEYLFSDYFMLYHSLLILSLITRWLAILAFSSYRGIAAWTHNHYAGLRSDTHIRCLWSLQGPLIININFTQCYARYFQYFTCRCCSLR